MSTLRSQLVKTDITRIADLYAAVEDSGATTKPVNDLDDGHPTDISCLDEPMRRALMEWSAKNSALNTKIKNVFTAMDQINQLTGDATIDKRISDDEFNNATYSDPAAKQAIANSVMYLQELCSDFVNSDRYRFIGGTFSKSMHPNDTTLNLGYHPLFTSSNTGDYSITTASENLTRIPHTIHVTDGKLSVDLPDIKNMKNDSILTLNLNIKNGAAKETIMLQIKIVN